MEDNRIQLLPERGHEVPAILLLTVNNQVHALGRIKENLNQPENVLVRLGTKVSDGHPSCVGFRVFLRTRTPKPNGDDSIEDHYHIVSCRFDTSAGDVSYTRTTPQDRDELANTQSISREELKASGDQDLYQINVVISDTNACIISHHGPKLQTTDNHVKEIEKLVPFVAYANRISVYFMADELLTASLDTALENGGVGPEAPSWVINLPNNSVTQWPDNVQSQTVGGLTDVLNILRRALHEKPLQDGPGTLVKDRLEAQQFKAFVRQNYPSTRQEPANKVYPIMLNVPGLCSELPFGGSMLNRLNTYAAVNALHDLLAAQVPPSAIGIVTLYPGQAQVYKDALNNCHRVAPQRGYDCVRVNILDDWVGKTVGIAIVDLVRTANAGGNLGYPSQANRLKVLLSRHQNGLILVGDIGCTTNSRGTVTSAKLEKVLQWFVDQGRIVQISDQGRPLSIAPILPTRAQISDSSVSRPPTPTSPTPVTAQPPPRRKYVGIPGLEHLTSAAISGKRPASPVPIRDETKDAAAANAPPTTRENLLKSRAHPGVKRDEETIPKVLVPNDGTQTPGHHPNPGTSFIRRPTPSPIGAKLIAKTTVETPGIGTPLEEKMANLRLANGASKHSAGETDKSPNVANPALNGTKVHGNPSENFKAPGSLSAPKVSGSHEGDGPSFESTKSHPKKEISTDAFDQLWRDSASKFSPRAATHNSGSSSLNAISGSFAPPAHSEVEDESKAMTEATPSETPEASKGEIPHLDKPIKLPPHKAQAKLSTHNPLVSASNRQDSVKTASVEAPKVEKEVAAFSEKSTNLPPRKAAPDTKKGNLAPSSQSTHLPPHNTALEVKKENVAPSAQLPKLPPRKASLKSQLQEFAMTAAKRQDRAKSPSPTQALQDPDLPSAVDPELLQIPEGTATATATTIPATPISQPPPAQAPDNVGPEQSLDFKTRYQPKYKRIRGHFATMDTTLPRSKEKEGQLFLGLAEAMVDEDESAFDAAYLELLGMAVKAETSVLRAKRQ